ncbi:MAG: type II toxin-antitoxin system HicB family antitoxin [Thermomicrobiales bacterium]|jgi:predicted RNase H-like HicB family nuclease
MRYTIVLTEEPDGSAYNVTVPAMPGCLTWGATLDEAMVHAREAIALHLEGYTERGEPYPVEARTPTLVEVDVEPLSAAS